jgi:hypothetical protein
VVDRYAMTKVVIPFSPPWTRTEIAMQHVGGGSCVYLAYDPTIPHDALAFVYVGTTVNPLARLGTHITEHGFHPEWTYQLAYPRQGLADLVYPFALAYYRKHDDWRRKSRLRRLSPEAAARRDVLVVPPGGSSKKMDGIHYRLEVLMLRWFKDRFGRPPRNQGNAISKRDPRLEYLCNVRIQFNAKRAIVSAEI